MDGGANPESSNRDAFVAAQHALLKSEIAKRHNAYARRYASEAAARATIGRDAIGLDEVVRNGSCGHQGGNFPIYDVSSRSEVASVKTHWNLKGELDEHAIAAYKRDFRRMLGWNREPNALSSDGANMVNARKAGVVVPEELENASEYEASVYLRDNSRLRIPDDHVSPVRAALAQEIRQFPNNYFLTNNPSDEQVARILERIQGIGIGSNELENLIATGAKPK